MNQFVYWSPGIFNIGEIMSDINLVADLRRLIEEYEEAGEWKLPPERRLMQQFNVGRRAIRHALDVLEGEGLIRRYQGKGTFIGSPAILPSLNIHEIARQTNPLELIDLRIEIEPSLARMATSRATPALIAQLERFATRAGQATDISGWEQWDSAFHSKIAEAAGNQLFLTVMGMIDEIRQSDAWRDFRHCFGKEDRNGKSTAEHMAIIDAMRSLQPQSAEQAMRDHLLSLRQKVEDYMQSANRFSDRSQ